MLDIKIKELMSSPVVTLHVEDSFSKVEEKLRLKGVRHLPVVDHYGKLVGLVTQRDLYRTMSPRITEEGYYYDKGALDSFVLKRVMTSDPFTLKPEDPISKVVEVMARNKFGCVPIVNDEGKPIGIVTEIDILKWVARHL